MRWRVKFKDNTILVGERRLIRDDLVSVGFWLVVAEIVGPLFIPWAAILYIEEIP